MVFLTRDPPRCFPHDLTKGGRRRRTGHLVALSAHNRPFEFPAYAVHSDIGLLHTYITTSQGYPITQPSQAPYATPIQLDTLKEQHRLVPDTEPNDVTGGQEME